MKEDNKARILRHFGYGHLPPVMHGQMAPVAQLAAHIANRFPQSEERNRALRKLLEAKDCLQRAALDMWKDGDPFAALNEVHQVTGIEDAAHYSSEWMRRHTETCQPTRAADPVTGEALPAGSPYSMAHAATRAAGEPVEQPEPPRLEDGLPDAAFGHEQACTYELTGRCTCGACRAVRSRS